MKRNFAAFGALLLCFSFFFWIGRKIPANPETFSSANASRTSGTKALQPDNSDLLHAAIWRELVEPKNSGELFDSIYQSGLHDFFEKEELRKAISDRFSREYPQDIDQHHRPKLSNELTGRLGILKVLHESFTPQNLRVDSTPLIGLYKQILLSNDEHWLVKRQALQNMAPWMPRLSPQERDLILAKQDPRALALATKSEREILKEAMEKNAF